MSSKILVVPDKFKGTLTAQAAAQSIAQGWREVRPGEQLDLLPMSDGGDGFGDVLSGLVHAEARKVETVDAHGQPREATWWWEPSSKTAIIESAQVIGLALLPPGRYHPFELDTFGLGAVLRAAAAQGAQECVIGIGGSATNDGGFGVARSMGWAFLGESGEPIEKWTQLDQLERIIPPRTGRDFSIKQRTPAPLPGGEPLSAARCVAPLLGRGTEVGSPSQTNVASALKLPVMRVAVDVQNPLLGPTGASRVYGPQKGLGMEDMPKAEGCLQRLRVVSERDLRLTPSSVPGDGAAGGLGFGLRCFAGAQLESGFKLFARYARLEERIRSSQLVITGEGAIDTSTLMGKGVGEVAGLCQRHGVPCIGMAGAVENALRSAEPAGPFRRVFGIAPDLADPERAKRDAGVWLARLAARVAESWTHTG
ncbi:MAG: glycerate kinase [Verrucomicrobia bacterium]|nr:glycerate kinase [Verrucomicrobiota bacterium]